MSLRLILNVRGWVFCFYNFADQIRTLKPHIFEMFLAKEEIKYFNMIIFERTELRHETGAFFHHHSIGL